ncbi:transposase [Nocardia gamkensis]|uniref:transposase n=1 Tax=Nocardia gamkensis TaxID=352869 RepID=UPI0036E46278
MGDLLIGDVDIEGDMVVVEATVATGLAQCPRCGTVSARVHSRYRRRLADAAVAGRRLVLRLVVRRSFCLSNVCPNNVYRFLRPYQASKASTRPAVAPPPKPRIRAVTGWIMRNPDTLPGAETQQLTKILTCCPELAATRRHVGAFAAIMRDLRGDRLPEWIAQVRADDLPALHSFATGLEHGFAAVTAGLTLPWSNGPTEGTVNRLKHLRRQCFGRANLDLLRKRILLTHATAQHLGR